MSRWAKTDRAASVPVELAVRQLNGTLPESQGRDETVEAYPERQKLRSGDMNGTYPWAVVIPFQAKCCGRALAVDFQSNGRLGSFDQIDNHIALWDRNLPLTALFGDSTMADEKAKTTRDQEPNEIAIVLTDEQKKLLKSQTGKDVEKLTLTEADLVRAMRVAPFD